MADALKPDRIIVGARSDETVSEFRRLYEAFNRNHDKMMFMDPRSAELTKYAANAMLATKISFINEIANIAEAVGADIESVRQGMGSDSRIGFQFIYPGIGLWWLLFSQRCPRTGSPRQRTQHWRATAVRRAHHERAPKAKTV